MILDQRGRRVKKNCGRVSINTPGGGADYSQSLFSSMRAFVTVSFCTVAVNLADFTSFSFPYLKGTWLGAVARVNCIFIE